VIVQPQSLWQWRWEANELPRLVFPLRTLLYQSPLQARGTPCFVSRLFVQQTHDLIRLQIRHTRLPLYLWRETDARQHDLAMNATDLQRVNNFVMLSEHVRCDDEEVTG
jgi:hypothetical protein